MQACLPGRTVLAEPFDDERVLLRYDTDVRHDQRDEHDDEQNLDNSCEHS